MAKCSRCGRKVANVYSWDGEVYGKECWKVVALPIIERRRKEALEEWKKEWGIECSALVSVLKGKDLSRISNSFKLEFIPSVIAMYDERGYLSYKQYDLALEMLTKKEMVQLSELEWELGIIDDAELATAYEQFGSKKCKQENHEFIEANAIKIGRS